MAEGMLGGILGDDDGMRGAEAPDALAAAEAFASAVAAKLAGNDPEVESAFRSSSCSRRRSVKASRSTRTEPPDDEVRSRRRGIEPAAVSEGSLVRICGREITITIGCLLMSFSLVAEVPAARVARDPRLPIALAEARRENWKCLMRGHLQTLTESMRLMSNGEFEAAAGAVERNFGLAPGTAEYCREPLFTRKESEDAAKVPPSPPPEVRAMFDEMQAAATTFVADSRAASRTNDPAAAWKSLAGLGATCSACHLAYRIN